MYLTHWGGYKRLPYYSPWHLLYFDSNSKCPIKTRHPGVNPLPGPMNEQSLFRHIDITRPPCDISQKKNHTSITLSSCASNSAPYNIWCPCVCRSFCMIFGFDRKTLCKIGPSLPQTSLYQPGPLFTKTTLLYGYMNPIINLRLSEDRNMVLMGMFIIIRLCLFFLKKGPWYLLY